MNRCTIVAATVLAGWATWAVAGELHDAARDGDTERVKQLVAEGADLSERDAFGTPLHHAAARGHVAVVELLLAEGAAVNAVAKDGAVPLHWAAFNGRTAVVPLLLQAGARVDVENPAGAPLHLAAQGGKTEVVEMLLDAGADPNGKMSFGFQNAPLHLAAAEGHPDTVALLIERGADVNAGTTRDYTPLHSVAESEGVQAEVAKLSEVARLLIEHGCIWLSRVVTQNWSSFFSRAGQRPTWNRSVLWRRERRSAPREPVAPPKLALGQAVGCCVDQGAALPPELGNADHRQRFKQQPLVIRFGHRDRLPRIHRALRLTSVGPPC